MGYTVFWYRKNLKDGFPVHQFSQAVEACRKAIDESCVQLELSSITDELIYFNGVYGKSCEPFRFPRVTVINDRSQIYDDFVFNFCKTRYFPYDLLVKTCLIILSHFFPGQLKLSSDGHSIDDWQDGVALASKVLGIAPNFELNKE